MRKTIASRHPFFRSKAHHHTKRLHQSSNTQHVQKQHDQRFRTQMSRTSTTISNKTIIDKAAKRMIMFKVISNLRNQYECFKNKTKVTEPISKPLAQTTDNNVARRSAFSLRPFINMKMAKLIVVAMASSTVQTVWGPHAPWNCDQGDYRHRDDPPAQNPTQPTPTQSQHNYAGQTWQQYDNSSQWQGNFWQQPSWQNSQHQGGSSGDSNATHWQPSHQWQNAAATTEWHSNNNQQQ